MGAKEATIPINVKANACGSSAATWHIWKTKKHEWKTMPVANSNSDIGGIGGNMARAKTKGTSGELRR